MCGEYGETFTRPHYHACLFGIDFDDKEPINKLASGAKLFQSATLAALWPHGYASVGAVTFQSAAYVARYVMKKITGNQAATHYTWTDEHGEIHQRNPEFNKMSLGGRGKKGGIGKAWYERFQADVYPADEVITNGHSTKPPRYYDKLLEKQHPELYDDIQFKRFLDSLDNKEDNTPERLKAKETVVTARTQTLKRNIS